ncbi:MAG TPA: YdcF family protein, partial [Xanthomonadales bacterium]|nr:YdcF family protein [Xanthomonadales bacterium]
MSDACINRRYWRDGDAVHGLAVAALAVLATGGLLLVPYFVHAFRTARRAPVDVARARYVLVFGRRLEGRAADAELVARVSRAHALLDKDPSRAVVLLGGRGDDGVAEADAAYAVLLQLGVPPGARIVLERESTDTLENLRHARRAGDIDGPVALVSSRYHLARCAMLARNLGFDAAPCAAEERFAWRAATLGKLALEALLL